MTITIDELLGRLEAEVYAKVPQMECKTGCDICCHRTFWTLIEDIRIRRHLAERGMEYRTESVWSPYVKGQKRIERCPYLEGGRCSIHDARPLVCRLFGVVVGHLHCPHVSAPAKLGDDEAVGLFHHCQMLSALAERVGGPEVERSRMSGTPAPRLTHKDQKAAERRSARWQGKMNRRVKKDGRRT
jgi:hypothetical protein